MNEIPTESWLRPRISAGIVGIIQATEFVIELPGMIEYHCKTPFGIVVSRKDEERFEGK